MYSLKLFQNPNFKVRFLSLVTEYENRYNDAQKKAQRLVLFLVKIAINKS